MQESLTNALKHAPGTPVHITLHQKPGHLEIEVLNPAAQQRSSGLEQSGSGRGLAGMRERAAACGGTVTAARTQAGGWRVTALLPVSLPDAGRGGLPDAAPTAPQPSQAAR